MSAMIILISASLIVATGFLLAFLWAVRNGQFEDRYTPSVRMLFDDKQKNNDLKATTKPNQNTGDSSHGS